MAQPTNTYDSYDQVGIREDLADVIYKISPEETPFFSKCKKGKASNTYHESTTWEKTEPIAFGPTLMSIALAVTNRARRLLHRSTFERARRSTR